MNKLLLCLIALSFTVSSTEFKLATPSTLPPGATLIYSQFIDNFDDYDAITPLGLQDIFSFWAYETSSGRKCMVAIFSVDQNKYVIQREVADLDFTPEAVKTKLSTAQVYGGYGVEVMYGSNIFTCNEQTTGIISRQSIVPNTKGNSQQVSSVYDISGRQYSNQKFLPSANNKVNAIYILQNNTTGSSRALSLSAKH